MTLIASIAAESTYSALMVLPFNRAKSQQVLKLLPKTAVNLFGIDAWIACIAKYLWDLQLFRGSCRFSLNPVTHPRVLSGYVRFFDLGRLD